jgi:ribonuclease III
LLSTREWAQSRLGHGFRDATLLEAALTHRSAGRHNYERLEFLGDAVLNFTVAVLLFREYPQADEGELSRYRAALVSGRTLAELAGELGLGEQLRMGEGELKTGGFRRGSMLADALEALFGAIYLDDGVEAAARVIEALFAGRLCGLPGAQELKDPKTRLQELLQARRQKLPEYRVIAAKGAAHKQVFEVECSAAGLGASATGSGASRRSAEQHAAEALLKKLEE